MTARNILLIGGSGFVGRHLINELSRGDVRITVPARRRERVKHLLPFAMVDVVEADVHDDATLTQLASGQDVVINLVGILAGGTGKTDDKPWGRGFDRAHVKLAGRVAQAAASAGASRLLHMSALRATEDAPSAYLRSKGAGETAVRAAFPGATIFQPSVIFGLGDSFLSMFATIAGLSPVFPLACAGARFQPVWVGDVAAVMTEAVNRSASAGQTYTLCGPKIYTLQDLVAYAAKVAGHHTRIMPLGDTAAWLQAFALELIGGPMTRDNLKSMELPSICDYGCTLPFGRAAAPLELIAPAYLADGRRRAGYDGYRETASR